MGQSAQKYITLKHLLIDGQKMIGLQFYPDKVIQALVKELPKVGWSSQYNMVCLPNKQENIDLIFRKFRGVAWVNCRHFFPNRPVKQGNGVLNTKKLKERQAGKNDHKCPDTYIDKLELRKYSPNTAKTYISCFEAFINFYNTPEPIKLDENDVRKYLQKLVRAGKSDSYINQAVNAIKFYYEGVLEMPNRFYSMEHLCQWQLSQKMFHRQVPTKQRNRMGVSMHFQVRVN